MKTVSQIDNNALAEIVFPNTNLTIEQLEEKFPKRQLKEGARVTRYAPSPTGFMHIGNLFTAFVSERVAHTTDGVFYVRIEDTDKKREVENGVEGILRDALPCHLRVGNRAAIYLFSVLHYQNGCAADAVLCYILRHSLFNSGTQFCFI